MKFRYILVPLLILLTGTLQAAEGNDFGSAIDFAMYKLATEQNDPSAQYLVGNNYLQGKTVNKDYHEAIQWFEKAAKQGHKKAQFQLGKMYMYGTGVAKNYLSALEFLQKAAENRHTRAQFELGNFYVMGASGIVDYTTASTWYRRAAKQNHREAQLKLGQILYEKRGEEEQPGEALKLLKSAANSGVHEASKYLRKIKNGEIRITKTTPPAAPKPAQNKRNTTQSLSIGTRQQSRTEQSGADGSDDQYRNAMAYLAGDGVDKDPVIAARLLRKAADNKHAKAQYQLSLLYKDGIGVKKSPDDAEIWLTHAAQNGLKQAQRALTKEDDSSKGKISSDKLALGETQYRLGLNFLNGSGGMQDAGLAARWLIKAAKQNHSPAMYQLGLMYRDGIGVAVNKKTAKRWFQTAAKQGEARAEAALHTLDDPAPVQIVRPEPVKQQEFTGRQQPEEPPVSRIVMNNIVNHIPDIDPVIVASIAPLSARTILQTAPRSTKKLNDILPTHTRSTPATVSFQSPLAQAARQGDTEAQYKLGMLYIRGSMVEKNIDIGMEWIHKAADNQHLDAQLHLASMYLNGEHKVSRDVPQAVVWYERAAESGDADAQFNLAEMYKNGRVLKKSNAKAIKWYRKAANQGHKKARNRMGGCRIC